MATSYTLAIQQLYVAYFNRPADPDGLAYWETVAARTRGDLSAASKDFSQSTEYRDLYAGMTNNQVVGAIYENLFGRPADAAGQKYWVDLLNSGKISVDYIVREVSNGARGSDAEIVENRGKAAVLFTEALDTQIEIDNYKKAAGGAIGRAFLDKITDDASFNAATATDALNSIMAPLSEVPVTKFDLTPGADIFTGTAGADQFFAEFAGIKADGTDATTIQANDVIDGGAGDDTLTIHVGPGYNEVLRGTFKNIEKILIDNDGSVLGKATGQINASKFQGAKEIWQMYDAVAITHLAADTKAGFKSVIDKTLEVETDGATANIALQTVKGNASNVVSIVASGGILNKVVVDGTIVRTTNTSGAPAASLNLDVTTGQDAKGVALPTLTVSTGYDTVLTVDYRAETGALTKVDLSSNANKFTYHAASNITTVLGGKGADNLSLDAALNATNKAALLEGGDGNDVLLLQSTNDDDVAGTTATVRGGAGNDEITVNVTQGATATKATVITVDGGAGDDTIHLMDANGYRFLTANDKLSGGEGNDTLVLATDAATIADAEYTKLNALSSIERVKFDNAVTGLDASRMNKVAQIEFTHATEVTKLATAQTVILVADSKISSNGYNAAAATETAKNDASVTANVTVVKDVAVDAFAKSVNVTVDAVTANAAIGADLTGDVDSANFILKSASAAKLATATVDASAAGAGFATVAASGTGSIDIDNSNGILKSIDTSNLSGTIGTTTIAGLTFAGNDAIAETIKLGGGLDDLTIASYAGDATASKIDTVTGLNLVATAGGGFAATSDKFELDLSHLTTTATAFANGGTVTGANLVAVLNTVSKMTDDAVVFKYAGNTYLFVENTAAGTTANSDFEATDFVVRLTGTTYDLDDLAALAKLSLVHPV